MKSSWYNFGFRWKAESNVERFPFRQTLYLPSSRRIPTEELESLYERDCDWLAEERSWALTNCKLARGCKKEVMKEGFNERVLIKRHDEKDVSDHVTQKKFMEKLETTWLEE